MNTHFDNLSFNRKSHHLYRLILIFELLFDISSIKLSSLFADRGQVIVYIQLWTVIYIRLRTDFYI